ncbi:MAG: M14 family metallopeptidase [Pseudomonadota bacterium]
MGEEINNSVFDKKDYIKFQSNLEKETESLNSLFNNKAISQDRLMGGFEIECWLLNDLYKPAFSNKEFIESFDSNLVTPELAKFNVEFNTTPLELSGSAISLFYKEISNVWRQAEQTVTNLNNPTSLLLIGTLPTLELSNLNIHAMSDMNRYHALNDEIMHYRKEKPLHLNIQGKDSLDIYSHDVMLESSTTSFQIHTKVPAKDAHHYYNASIIISAPLVAISANSPYAFGKNLWAETRIPLFEQSVDTGNKKSPFNRVSFGSGFAKNSILECFEENLKDFYILLPIIDEDNSSLPHLRLHNGTIWRWNRPLIGFDKTNQLHFRIEHRALPAGPTCLDMMANAAFYFGLQEYWAQKLKHGNSLPNFGIIKDNFYKAAAGDLNTKVQWNENTLTYQSLIKEILITQSKEGLEALSIDQNDIEMFLGIIEARVLNCQTGADWQRKYVERHHCDMAELTHAYQLRQKSGQPVHTWELNRSQTKISRNKQTLELNELESYPKELLDISVEDLYRIFPQPTLLHLQGKSKETIFISVLLHGNESTGFYVAQALLKKYLNKPLPRCVSIFFGNTQAARHGKRFLNSQLDYNRVWPGTDHTHSKEALIMEQVINELKTRNLFASIDIHNNTGLNPHYACINKLDNEFLNLAALFSKTAVYFLSPNGVQSMALSQLCPSVTLECGKAGSKSGLDHALEYVEAVIYLSKIAKSKVAPRDLNLFQTIARIKIPKNVSFSFNNDKSDLQFDKQLEKMNFSEMPADTCFGETKCSTSIKLDAYNDNNENITDNIFYMSGNKILLRSSMMPAMLTLDENVIKQDCLCYMMKRIHL